jgi:hypothetical protein
MNDWQLKYKYNEKKKVKERSKQITIRKWGGEYGLLRRSISHPLKLWKANNLTGSSVESL